LALLIAFALAVNGLNVVNSYVGRDFMTAIAHRDLTGFIQQAALYVGVFAASTAVAVLYRFSEERLGLFWRVWMTRRTTRRYLADRTYLGLKESAAVANPDQRIADDVRTFAPLLPHSTRQNCHESWRPTETGRRQGLRALPIEEIHGRWLPSGQAGPPGGRGVMLGHIAEIIVVPVEQIDAISR
jgi:hypothetical protein